MVPLYLTAGTMAPGGSGAVTRHIVTVCVSYWSEACQPKHHAIKALTDTAEQVLARQATLTVHVDIMRHLRVASVLSRPASVPARPQNGDTAAEQTGLGNLDLTVQLVRQGTDRALMVRCFCIFLFSLQVSGKQKPEVVAFIPGLHAM